MDLLERMLNVLRQQKQLLLQEIADNKELGLKVGCCNEFFNFTANILIYFSLFKTAKWKYRTEKLAVLFVIGTLPR